VSVVVLQALLAFVARSVGRIFHALFGWAVTALFGVRPRAQSAVLSVVVAAAAAWPLLVLGIFFPRLTTFLVAFVKLPEWISPALLRAAWFLATLAVPIAMGLFLARYAARKEALLARLVNGFPATVGVASAFAVVAVAVPVRKALSFVRKKRDEHLPLVVTLDAYEDVARRIEKALGENGFEVSRVPAPWTLSAPSLVLRRVGGADFRREIPRRFAAFRGRDLEAFLTPTGVTLSGKGRAAVTAHGLLQEALCFGEALQTMDPDAQALERRMNDLSHEIERAPKTSAAASRSRAEIESVARALLAAEVPYDDWQILYRLALQLARAASGEEPLLASTRGSARQPSSLVKFSPRVTRR